jgi:hypothetical protein
MKRHTVTIEDILPDIQNNIRLSLSISKTTGHRKLIVFHLAELKYRVTLDAHTHIESSSFYCLEDAIEKYNEYDV